MVLADSINRLLFVMEMHYVYIQLGNKLVNVIQVKFPSFSVTWLSAKGHINELRRREPHNCSMLLHRTFSLGLSDVDMSFRWSQDAPISALRMHRHCYGCALVSKPAAADASSLLLFRRV
jgi:hypothetical protein